MNKKIIKKISISLDTIIKKLNLIDSLLFYSSDITRK